MSTPHVIVCGSESEISIVTQQHLAVSALIARTERALSALSAGILSEADECELRVCVAHVKAAFKLPSRQFAHEPFPSEYSV